MHCIILKETLTKALSLISRSVATKPQLPILSHILLEAKKTSLILSATNLEIGVQGTLAASVTKEGEVALPGKLFIEFINTIPSHVDKLELFTEGNLCIVKAKNIKTSFAIGTASEFPPFPSTTEERKHLPFHQVKDVISRIAFAASTDDSRPVLTGIRLKQQILDGQKYSISLSATDGYRLSMDSILLPSHVDDMHVILPASSLVEVMRIAVDLNVSDIGFAIIPKKNQVMFFLDSVTVFTRLIDGEFPHVEKIIPQSCKTRAVVEVSTLLSAIKTASLFARSAANIIKLRLHAGGITVSAHAPQIGSNEDHIDASVDGEEVEMAFNYRFLLDLLSHFPETHMVIESSGALSPGLFKPEQDAISFLHVIMPVRVQV